MPAVKKIALGILSPLFIFLLFATAFYIGLARTVTHPETVKKLVSESGIYSAVAPSLLEQAKSISTSYGNIPTTDPDLKKAANTALPPRFIQQNTEMAIDNVYHWLDGDIAQPNFNIDLSGAKTLFANNIADALQKRLDALPACSAAESRSIAQSGNFDAYNAACLPRGIDSAAAAEQVKASIVSGDGFLSDTNLSASNIKNGDSTQPIFEQAGVKNIPTQYQRAKKAPIILSILTVLCGVAVVILSSTWQKGLRHIGINLVVVGALMLVFSYTLGWIVSTKVVPKIKFDNIILQSDIRNLVVDLGQQIDKN
jgi:hypothetical protein